MRTLPGISAVILCSVSESQPEFWYRLILEVALGCHILCQNDSSFVCHSFQFKIVLKTKICYLNGTWNIKWHLQLKKILKDFSLVCEALLTLFCDVCLCFKAREDSLGGILCHLHMMHTSDSPLVWHQPLGGKYGNQAPFSHLLFHVVVGLKLEYYITLFPNHWSSMI